MSLNSRKSSLSGIKLIIAIDVGTTFTAASFCLLDENGHPHKLQEVSHWKVLDYFLLSHDHLLG